MAHIQNDCVSVGAVAVEVPMEDEAERGHAHQDDDVEDTGIEKQHGVLDVHRYGMEHKLEHREMAFGV